jgi:Polysaccharide lyase
MRLNVVVNPDQTQLPGTAAIATQVWSEPFQLGVWYDWVFRYRPSTDADGIIEAWRNGEKIYSQTGANRFVLDNCNLPATPQTYMKVGIYREQANTSTQQLAYDEARIFAGSNGYSAVAPK